LRLAAKGNVPRITEANATLTQVRRLEAVVDVKTRVILSPGGRHALLKAADGVGVWDENVGKEARRFRGHATPPDQMAFSPDGTYAVTSSSSGPDRTVRAWEVATGKETWKEVADGVVRHLSVSRDGQTVAALVGGEVRLWLLKSGKLAGRFPAPVGG